tara:strand:+ start:190 stop:294 length:105 start_codon:yes stop_codon:yes gene_type:complete
LVVEDQEVVELLVEVELVVLENQSLVLLHGQQAQ